MQWKELFYFTRNQRHAAVGVLFILFFSVALHLVSSNRYFQVHLNDQLSVTKNTENHSKRFLKKEDSSAIKKAHQPKSGKRVASDRNPLQEEIPSIIAE